VETFGVVVIGAGPGGYPAAIRAAQLGASVALVEREYLGGTCLNWGCIPSKAFIHTSDLYAQMRSSANLGLKVEKASFDYAAMAERKDQVVRTLRNGVKQLLAANGVKVIEGTASFESRKRIVVNAKSRNTVIGAEKTIIATGATSSMPGFLPQHERVMDSRAFLDLKSTPGRALVLGGGVIGCEFACMLAQLGVQVTIVEILEDIVALLDADVRRELRRQMEKTLGIRILTGKSLENIKADGQAVRGSVGGEVVEADLLLAALGRKPVTQELRLENAGLKTNQQGFIEVDEYGITQVSTIYAIGDVTGGPQLAHAATSQGLVAGENACTRQRRKNEKCIPYCIFTSPEVGAVGLTEQEAQQKGLEVKTGKFNFAALGKALAIGHPAGFVKWVADAKTEQLLGAQVVGVHATELIAEATTAIRAELTATELAQTIHSHPTLAEAWMEAADVLLGDPIHTIAKRPR
jgi:dihydrolipoamide dehydrogenase